MFKKLWELLNSSSSEAPAATSSPSPSHEPEAVTEVPESLRCPACSGPLEIEFIGRQQSDKVANCPYCRGTIDLPETANDSSPVRTRERVIERPNEKIVERITEYSPRHSTETDWPAEFPAGLEELKSGLLRRYWDDAPFDSDRDESGQTWEINGQKFSSKAEMHAFVRETFPASMADRMLDLLDRTQRSNT